MVQCLVIQGLICIVPFWGSYSEPKGNSTLYDLYDVYDLYDLYDIYDLAHVAGWDPYNLHGLQ